MGRGLDSTAVNLVHCILWCWCTFSAALEIHDHWWGSSYEKPSLQADTDPQHLLHCSQPSAADRDPFAGQPTTLFVLCASPVTCAYLLPSTCECSHKPPLVASRQLIFLWLDLPLSISRVSDQNGISWLYIIVEIHHSGRKPSISSMLRWFASHIFGLKPGVNKVTSVPDCLASVLVVDAGKIVVKK